MKDPLIGLQFANFKVERLIGQGGMAIVYYGEDIKLHRAVAIKVLDKRFKNHPAYASRFVNEARMMAKWHHENIIQIYYADDAQGFPYYVMEYVDGQDLGKIMETYHEERKLMPIAEALRIGKAVASALDYAHRHGVVHRDVKPANILLSKDGRVLLGDFGMALEVREGSQGQIFGTPHYISPEQAKNSADAVPQSDIYSLGVIMYEILTGSVPFNDPSPVNIAIQHISEKPPAPRSLNPTLSEDVEKVLLKVLEKNTKERHQSSVKFMAELERALTSAGAAKKASLPPLPVGVPTIQRSEEEVQNRPVPKNARNDKKEIIEYPATVRVGISNRKWNYWLAGLLVFLGIVGVVLFNKFNPRDTAPVENTSVENTPVIYPSATSTETPPPSPTFTSVPTDIPATATLEPTATVVLVPTVLYPEGAHYTLFYNETSLFIYNHSYERRSISGFTFQGLDENGVPTEDIFDGYRWETLSIDYLPRNFCANITIYGDQNPPYLNPEECKLYGLTRTVQTRFDRPEKILFWLAKNGATQFVVYWLKEEVARCDIPAGQCEIYIP